MHDTSSIAARSGNQGSALSRVSYTDILVCVNTNRLNAHPRVSSLRLYVCR